MKARKITIEYTNGTKKEIIPKPKNTIFLIGNSIFQPTKNWNVGELYEAVGTAYLSALKQCVGDYKSYAPLFDEMEKINSQVQKQLSPAQYAKDFAVRFHQVVAWDYITREPEWNKLYLKVKKDVLELSKKMGNKEVLPNMKKAN